MTALKATDTSTSFRTDSLATHRLNVAPLSAVVWAKDHPYAAVTDNKGNFEIKSVPTGVELGIIAWHEAKGNFDTKKITLKKGETQPYNLKVK